MPPTLPLEIYHLIIGNVNEKMSLCSLARCCSAFRDEAQRLLFRDVQPTSFRQQKQFLAVINGAPLRFGPFVQSFCAGDLKSRDPDRQVALAMALQAMCSLEHLKLHWWTPSTIIQGCTFKLRTLVCGYRLDHAQVSFILCDFLPTQPSIKHIEIRITSLIGVSKLPQNLCPELKSLGIESSQLSRVLLDENTLIPHFQWYDVESPPPLTIRQLNYLKSFFCYLPMQPVDTPFAQHLTSLIDLELCVMVYDPNDLFQHLFLLRYTTRLQFLMLDIDPLSRMPNDGLYLAFRPAFRRAFELCPGLNNIDAKQDFEGEKRYARIPRPTILDGGDLVWTEPTVHSGVVKDWRFVV